MDLPVHSRLTRRSLLRLTAGAGLAAAGWPSTSGRAAGNAIHITTVVDTTGVGGVYGRPALKGMELAAAEINAQGGVNGHTLNLKASNGRSDVAHIATLVRRACHDPATVALLGPTLSSEAVKVDPIAQAAGLPVLAISNTVPGLTAIGNYIFRLPLGDDKIIPLVLKTAEAQFHFKKVAVLYDHVNAATAGGGQVFKTVAAEMGLTLVAVETFASGTTQFARQLEMIKASKPDVILVSALAPDAVLILKQRLASGISASTPIIGANGLNTPALISGAGAAAEGVIVGTAYDPGGAFPRNQRFKAAFLRRYQQAPDGLAAQGYDGVYTLATALRHVNTTTDRRTLRAALANLKGVPSVLSTTGRFAITAQREANLLPTVRIVRHGRFVRFP